MQLKIETVTPKKAEAWLKTNLEHQRNVSHTHVSKLAEMMRANEFDGLNGESIKFDKDGNLIDGQHRLRAIIESGCSIKTAILRNCSTKAFKTIDNSQNNRSVENYFEIAQQDHAKVASQVAKWLYGLREDSGRATKGKRIRNKTAGFLADWAMSEYPDIPDAIEEISPYLNSFQKAGLGTKAHLAFCYYLMREQDQLLAYDVVKFLAGGMEPPAPVFGHLRQTLLEWGIANAKDRVPGIKRFHMVVNSILVVWNSYRRGRPLRGVRGVRTATTNSMKESALPVCQ
jgi:hypothetical protein